MTGRVQGVHHHQPSVVDAAIEVLETLVHPLGQDGAGGVPPEIDPPGAG